jgi:hypothetical protein
MRSEDFSEIESELTNAMEQLDETNTRVEALLQEHAKPETDAVNQPVSVQPEENK